MANVNFYRGSSVNMTTLNDGDLYFNTSTGIIYMMNGSSVVQFGGGGSSDTIPVQAVSSSSECTNADTLYLILE